MQIVIQLSRKTLSHCVLHQALKSFVQQVTTSLRRVAESRKLPSVD